VPQPVTVVILAPALPPGAGVLGTLLDDARTALGERHAAAFAAAGAGQVVVHREPADAAPFGARLRRVVALHGSGGLVLLGAGAMPLATVRDRRTFVEAAAGDEPAALANNAYSADAIAVACAGNALRDVPEDLPTDNALPRWLAEVAGVPVHDLATRRDLAFDIDSPLDLLLLAAGAGTGPDAAGNAPGPGLTPVPAHADAEPVRARLAALRGLAQDVGAELLLAGRVNGDDLRAVERGSRARTRAVIEERGLRTAMLATTRGRPNRRPPRSLLAHLLEQAGPARLGELVADHADGALLDTRVLMAARAGADESAWPPPEDRYASDLLLPDRVADPWLRALTASAASAPIPILLGAHTLVGPGAVLALGLPREADAG